MKRGLALALAALLATCQPADTGGAADGAALVSLDLEALAGALRTGEQLPAVVEIELDGAPAGQAVLRSPDGQLDGYVALAVAPWVDHSLSVEAELRDGSHLKSERVALVAGGNEVLRLHVGLSSERVLEVGGEEILSLPADTHLAVDYAEHKRLPTTVALDGADPARTIARWMRVADVATVTPYTRRHSDADRVGPLLAPRPVLRSIMTAPLAATVAAASSSRPASASAARLVERPETEQARRPRTRAELLDQPPTAPAPERPVVVEDPAPTTEHTFMFYWAYCSCALPSVGSTYTMRTPDGRELRGWTDRFGMLVVEGVEDAKLFFDGRIGQRKRSYAYKPNDGAVHRHMLAGLRSADANERLVAMLDLRREPLEEAREQLAAMLESRDFVSWFNAAVTLSHYEDLSELVSTHIARLDAPGADLGREIALLGALRHPRAVEPIVTYLAHPNAGVRSIAAWSLGFIASPRALPALHSALHDTAPAVRAEAALALGRIGSDGRPLPEGSREAQRRALLGESIMDALSAVTGDPDPAVTRAVEEARDLVLF